jgi:hypothetical protein
MVTAVTTAYGTRLGELLKRLYASWEIESQVNLTYPVLAECAREGSASLGGSGFYFPVRVSSAEGHAYISETQALPVGRVSTVRQAVVTPTVHVGVVILTGLSMAVSSGSAAAFARAFDENVSQTIEAMSAYKEGCLFRTGTGILATTAEAGDGSGGQVITVDDTGFLRTGMFVDFIDDGTAAARANGKELGLIDWVNKEVTLEASTSIPTTITSGATMHIAGSQAATGAAAAREPVGLPSSVTSTSDYLGISRTTYPNWRGNTKAVSGFFDEAQLLLGRTRITQETGIRLAGMGRRMKCLCHPMQADVLFKLAIPRIRYSGNESFDLGNDSEVKFGNIQFMTTYMCPANVAYLGDWSYHQALYTPNGKLHIDTEYNGSAMKWVANYDQGIVFAKEYCAFANKRPQAFISFTSLTEASR